MAKQEFFSINFDRGDLEQFFAGMQLAYGANSKQMEKAQITALNETSKGWKKEGLEIVKNLLTLKNPSKEYNDSVSVLKATSGRPYIVFRAIGRSSLPLSDYQFKKNLKPGRKGGRAAAARVGKYTRPSPRALEKDGRKGFVFKGKNSGKMLLGERSGKKSDNGREILRVFYAPSLLGFLNKASTRQILLESTFARFQKRVEHDLDSVMKGLMRPARRGKKRG